MRQLLHSPFVTRFVTAGVLIVFLVFLFSFPPYLFSAVIISGLAYILLVEIPRLQPLVSFFWGLLLLGYCVVPAMLLIFLNEDTYLRPLIPIMISLTASFDCGAYFVGSLAHLLRWKNLLAPTISPHKTWQGCGGGFCTLFLAGLIVQLVMHKQLTLSFPFILLILSISIFATGGDLLESALKRRVGIKDTGTILPGHGGLLDRIDSHLFVIYLFYFFRAHIAQLFL